MNEPRMGRPKQTVGTPVTCSKCGYEWKTLSQARLVHCSQCQKLIRNPRFKPKEAKP